MATSEWGHADAAWCGKGSPSPAYGKESEWDMNKQTETKAMVAGEGSMDGFVKLTTDVELYYNPTGPDGQPIAFQGIVLEKRERAFDPKTGKAGAYFIVQATKPFEVKDGNKAWTTAKVGDHVWIDERASYARMSDMLPKQTSAGTFVCEVLYKPTSKVALKGGKTMWKGELFAKPLAPHQHSLGDVAALMTPTSAAQLPEHIGEDD